MSARAAPKDSGTGQRKRCSPRSADRRPSSPQATNSRWASSSGQQSTDFPFPKTFVWLGSTTSPRQRAPIRHSPPFTRTTPRRGCWPDGCWSRGFVKKISLATNRRQPAWQFEIRRLRPGSPEPHFRGQRRDHDEGETPARDFLTHPLNRLLPELYRPPALLQPRHERHPNVTLAARSERPARRDDDPVL